MRGYIDGEKIRLSEEIQDALFEAVGRCPEIIRHCSLMEEIKAEGHTDENDIFAEAKLRLDAELAEANK